MNRGLYIHFPFCEKKCYYCDFYSLADTRLKEEYISALVREIEKNEKNEIDTVFFGGGTPSLFSPSELERVITAINKAFILDKNAEITIEANPTSQNLSAFRSLGINRLSLGVQSFSDDELQALGRGHTAREAEETVLSAKKAGFDNISIDLMLGTPTETKESFIKSVEKALSLPLSHISLYALSIEENTVFGKKLKNGEDLSLPENDREMYLEASRLLKENGFEHYEISNFSKEGKRSRHNMKYWRGEEYIGLGASAHSYFKGERYAYPRSIKAFIEGAEKEDVYKNTKKDRKEEFIFLSLRLSDGLDLEGLTLREGFYPFVEELEKHGLAHLKNNRLSLTDEGFFVSNEIIVRIMEELKI